MTPNTEIELKLSAAPDVIEVLARSAPMGQAGRGRRVFKNLESTYFDTSDLRLRNRGFALRVRKDGNRYVQTMKASLEAGGAIARRAEWECAVPGPAPDLASIDDAEARARLGLILPGELRPVFTNRVRREVLRVNGFDAAGRTREIEIAVDLGEIQAGEITEPIAEIELELLHGAPETVFDLALALHRIRPVQVETRSKSDRGYALSSGAVSAWHKAKPIRFNPDTTIDQALAAVFNACFKHWTANERAALDGRDPEGVHQMRVGLRRLRSALSIFGPLLPQEALTWLRDEARYAIGALGEARDFDVFLAELLAPVIDEFPGNPALIALKREAERVREISYERARTTIASPRYTEFVLRFGAWVEGCRWRSDESADAFDEPLLGYADKLLERRHYRALKRGRKFEKLSVEDRHRVRIALKQLRYTSEFFESLHPGRGTKRYVKSLARMQDSLGHLNDVAVAERLVSALAESAVLPSEQSTLQHAAGLLIGWYSRGVTDSEPETIANWNAFASSTPFWRPKKRRSRR